MAAEPKDRILRDENLIWLLGPIVGIAAGYGIIGSTVWIGTVVAGSSSGGIWPGLGTAASAIWAVISQGARIDEWLLNNTRADAVTSPLWFWLLAAVQFALAVSLATLVWLAAGDAIKPRSKPTNAIERDDATKRDEQRDQRRAAKSMRVPRWPAKGPYSHPRNPSPGVLLGLDRRHLIADTTTTPVMVIGPTSSGKTRHVIAPNVALWPGPVIATSVKPDLAELTVALRADRGPVWGFDPTGRLWPAMRALGIEPVVWDPVRLFAQSPDPADALLLAEFLMGQVSAGNSGNQKVWKNHSVQTMTRMLVIAKDLQQPLSQVLRWMAEPKHLTRLAKKPALLQKLSPDGNLHFEMLAETMNMDKRIVDSIKTTMTEVSNLLEWTGKNPAATLMPMTMTTDGTSGTLYLVADHASMETHAAVFAGSLRHLFHSAETYGDRSQRLNRMILEAREAASETARDEMGVDPAADPLTRTSDVSTAAHVDTDPAVRPLFALDELASLAILQDLPEIVSTIRARAQLLCGIQEAAQLSRRWGSDGAKSLLGNHPTKLQLGGSGDAEAMRALATMSGLSGATAAQMRMIEEGRALVTHGPRISFEIDLADMERFIKPDRVSEIDIDEALAAALAEPEPAPAPEPAISEPDPAEPARGWPAAAAAQPPRQPNEAGQPARHAASRPYDGEPAPPEDYYYDEPAGAQNPGHSALTAVQDAAARERAMGAIGAAAGRLAAGSSVPLRDGTQEPGPTDPSPSPAAEARSASEPSQAERLRIGTWLVSELDGGGTDPANVSIVAEMLKLDTDELGHACRAAHKEGKHHAS